MPEKRDYYDILGVSKRATDEQLKIAFRKKALEYHPDRNKSKDAEEKFKEINEAYQILSDSEKRAKYDQFGHAGVTGAAGSAGFPSSRAPRRSRGNGQPGSGSPSSAGATGPSRAGGTWSHHGRRRSSRRNRRWH